MHSLPAFALLVMAAAAVPTQSSSTGKLKACEAAPNCETYWNSALNRTQIRFKEGMGPNSDWYHQNVRMKDPHHPMNKAKRGLMPRDDNTKYNSDRSTSTVDYGYLLPVDVVDSMNDNCNTASCDNKQWTLDSGYDDEGFLQGETIMVTGGGEWDSSDPDNRGNFIDGLKAESKPSSEYEKSVATDAYSFDSQDYNFSTGMDYLDINRYVGANLQGFISINVEVMKADDDTCDSVTTILQDAIGAVTGIGAGFFGIAAELTCNAESSGGSKGSPPPPSCVPSGSPVPGPGGDSGSWGLKYTTECRPEDPYDVYGALGTNSFDCSNLIDDKPWDSIIMTRTGGVQIQLFANPDCDPCGGCVAVNSDEGGDGAVPDSCLTSIPGVNGAVNGTGFAKSFRAVLNGDAAPGQCKMI